jgi:multidrug efflux pump subunit AcrA (membrane-fusion protein)
MTRWIIGLIVLVAIVFVGWRYFGGDDTAQQAAQQAQEAAQQAAEQAATAAQQAGEAAQQAAEEAATATQEAVQGAAETAQAAAEQASEAAGQATAAVGDLAQSLQALTVGGVDIGSKIGGAVDSLTGALAGITDGPTAEAAKAKIDEAGQALSEVGATVEQLPAEGRKLLADTLSAALPTIRAGIDRVTAIEGVGAELKPTLDGIYARLEEWARAPA